MNDNCNIYEFKASRFNSLTVEQCTSKSTNLFINIVKKGGVSTKQAMSMLHLAWCMAKSDGELIKNGL